LKKKIAVFTYDLVPGREKLMPWRTVLEVVRRMREHGHEGFMVSINRDDTTCYMQSDFDVPVRVCPGIDRLQACFDDEDGFVPDLVYWPVTWRSGMASTGKWHCWGCPTIAYHGGSCYGTAHILAAIRSRIPPGQLKGLLAEIFCPKRFLIKKLRQRGVSGVVCMSEFTRRSFEKAGWPSEKSIAIPPGLPRVENIQTEEPKGKKSPLIPFDQKYVLFLGNPLLVRGTDILLSAATRVFAREPSAAIVCLLRPDPGGEMTRAREKIIDRASGMGVDRQFICITETLPPHVIRHSIENARAVVMPFLYVPSEIPLGVLEAMQAGVPVITTRTGGTSEFVGRAGWIVEPGNAVELAEAILQALNDDAIRMQKVEACREKMELHPNWDEVGDEWLRFGLNASGCMG
jgi:phosphatidyl-myo-inositol dimannoside synthase